MRRPARPLAERRPRRAQISAEQLASLYSSKADYCAKFDAATDAAVAAGFFLEADAPEIKAIAAELFPTP